MQLFLPATQLQLAAFWGRKYRMVCVRVGMTSCAAIGVALDRSIFNYSIV